MSSSWNTVVTRKNHPKNHLNRGWQLTLIMRQTEKFKTAETAQKIQEYAVSKVNN